MLLDQSPILFLALQHKAKSILFTNSCILLIHLSIVYSSILNVTLEDLTNVHHGLDKLKTSMRITEELIYIMNTKMQEIKQGLMMLKNLLCIQLALSIISADHINLRIGLQTMMKTYVSPHIVTISKLLKLLDDISVKSPGLSFPPKLEFWYS